jgi:hypothetical protein
MGSRRQAHRSQWVGHAIVLRDGDRFVFPHTFVTDSVREVTEQEPRRRVRTTAAVVAGRGETACTSGASSPSGPPVSA